MLVKEPHHIFILTGEAGTPCWSPTMHPLSTWCLAPCLWSTNYYHVWPRTWQLPTCVLRWTTRYISICFYNRIIDKVSWWILLKIKWHNLTVCSMHTLLDRYSQKSYSHFRSMLPLYFTLDMFICRLKVIHAHPKSARIQNSTHISRIHLVPWMVPTWIAYHQHTCGCCSEIARVQLPGIVFSQVISTQGCYMCWLGGRGWQQMHVYTRIHRGIILPFQMDTGYPSCDQLCQGNVRSPKPSWYQTAEPKFCSCLYTTKVSHVLPTM
jgi:hypothetical protein